MQNCNMIYSGEIMHLKMNVSTNCRAANLLALADLNIIWRNSRSDEAVKKGIYQVSAIFSAVSYLLCALILAFLYPMNKEKIAENVAEVEKRRKAS